MNTTFRLLYSPTITISNRKRSIILTVNLRGLETVFVVNLGSLAVCDRIPPRSWLRLIEDSWKRLQFPVKPKGTILEI